MSGALPFLDSVAGYVASQRQSSADRPIRLATIDPAWSALDSLLPKVTFDGEAGLSGKRYAFLETYTPTPSDRVVMVPVGTTYLILGKIGTTILPSKSLGIVKENYYTGGSPSVGITNTEVLTNMDTGMASLKAGRLYHVLVKFKTTATVNGDTFVFRLRDAGVAGTQRGEFVWVVDTTAFGISHPLLAFRYVPAADESKTFVWTAQRIGGTGAVNVDTGGATNQVYMSVEDKGASWVSTLVG